MRRLTDILEEMQAVTRSQIRAALSVHQRQGRPIGACLVDNRACSEQTIVKALSLQLGVPRVKVENMAIPPNVIALVHREIADWYKALPLGLWQREGDDHNTLHVAMSRPTDREAIQHLRKITGYPIAPFVAGDREIESAIARCYGATPPVEDTLATAAMDDWIDLGD